VLIQILWGILGAWVEFDENTAFHVRVSHDIVAEYVVLHHMLVNPNTGASHNPALGQPEKTIHIKMAGDGPVVRIVLNVETRPRNEEAQGSSKIPHILSGEMDIEFQTERERKNNRQFDVIRRRSKRPMYG